VFSGGTYDEVARWLGNFLISHAKREHPRVEVELESGDERQGTSYAARLRFGDRVSAPIELPYREVADGRGSLAWCTATAQRIRALARELMAAGRERAGAR
jgi:hypothetical protein